MIGRELLDVIAENPDLPVCAMVSYEGCQGDSYCWWFASSCDAGVDEVVREDEINAERLWVRSQDEDEMIEQYVEGDESDASDAEVEELARNYVKNLPWERCVLLWLDV